MKIRFDEHGLAVPDGKAEQFARDALQLLQNIHISNMTVHCWLRAILFQMPVAERPEVQWFIGDREVHFNENLRSPDAWSDETSVLERALEILIGGESVPSAADGQ